MKKIKLVRNLLIIVLAFAVMFVFVKATSVFAEDDDLFQRINATNDASTAGNTAGTTNTAGTGNTATTNQTGNTTSIGNISGSNTSVTNQVTNRSISNTNELADTGIGSTGGIITLIVVVCGISAIYSYRKVNDYKNL